MATEGDSLVRTFAGVQSQVIVQCIRSVELLAAGFARVKLFARVTSFVQLQVGARQESLPAKLESKIER